MQRECGWLCTCVCILCIYVCVCTRICSYIHASMPAFIHSSTRTCIHNRSIRSRINTVTHIHIVTRIHIQSHEYTHTFTRIHTHMNQYSQIERTSQNFSFHCAKSSSMSLSSSPSPCCTNRLPLSSPKRLSILRPT